MALSLASTMAIQGTMTGLDSNTSVTVGITQQTGFALAGSVSLGSGANTITVPAGVVGGVVIKPPSGNTQTLTLKGVTGDTGVPVSKVNGTMLAFDTSPPASFVLTAGGAIANVELYWF